MSRKYRIGVDGNIKNYFFAEVVSALSEYYEICFNIEEKDLDFIFCVNEIRKQNINPNIPIVAWIGERPTWLYFWKEFKYRTADIIFVTEKGFVEQIKQIVGHNNVFFLPLATSFTVRNIPKGGYKNRISFVGNSMQKQIANIENGTMDVMLLPLRKEDFRWIHLEVDSLDLGDFTSVMSDYVESARMLKKYVEVIGQYSMLRSDIFLSYIGMCLTRARRIQVIDSLVCRYPEMVLIPSEWSSIVQTSRAYDRINYRDVSTFYGSCLININISSMHMPSALNSRVFDVPGSGGFLLTDYREGIEELFERDEAICYNSVQELIEYIDYYERHDEERMCILQKAYNRVQKQHLYRHRVEYMIDKIRYNLL